jgi:hypothetical protein
MGAGKLVLENSRGEVVRTFAFEGKQELSLIYRHDTRRVDVAIPAELKRMRSEKIKFDVLKESSLESLKRRGFVLDNGGKFRWLAEVQKTASSVSIPEDSQAQEIAIYKRTAYTQLGIMLFVLIAGLLIEPLLFPKQEEAVVTVIPQAIIPKTVTPTVPVAEKHQEVQKFAKKKIVSKVKKVQKTLTAHVKTPRKENATLRTKNVQNMGALGALGGMKAGSKNSAGFNMNALNDSKGTSWNGAGSGGIGGMERAVPGKGLIASAIGRGGRVEGGGGYGTRGKSGGGRPGYGQMNMGGTAAAYFEPVQEDAVVEGGLDKDQIEAVINRHLGEVIYCYEQGLQTHPNLSGRVGVDWVINGRGVVTGARVGNSSLNSAQVEGCIVNRLRGWQFPKPVGGVNVKVSFPFLLKRMSHG